MNRNLWAGCLAGVLATQMVAAQTAPPSSTMPQAIPDAPRPQALPLGPITPGLGTTSSSSADGAAPVDPDAPGSSLPTTPAVPAVHEDDGAAPDLPAAGEGVKAFTLVGQGVNFVQVPFTVKDKKGALVPGITWREVRVFENGCARSRSCGPSIRFRSRWPW